MKSNNFDNLLKMASQDDPASDFDLLEATEANIWYSPEHECWYINHPDIVHTVSGGTLIAALENFIELVKEKYG